MTGQYVSRAEADILSAALDEHLRQIEVDLYRRILARLRAGDDAYTAATEEVHRSLAQVDAAEAAFRKASDELPTYPAPDEGSDA